MKKNFPTLAAAQCKITTTSQPDLLNLQEAPENPVGALIQSALLTEEDRELSLLSRDAAQWHSNCCVISDQQECKLARRVLCGQKKRNCQVWTRVYVRVTVCLSAVTVCGKLLVCRLKRVSIGGAKHLSRPLFLIRHHCDQSWLVKENMIISQFIFISTLQLYIFKVFVLGWSV